MHKLVPYLSAAVLLTIVFGTIYTTQQQSLRLGANDPQVQLAEDTAAQLNAGTSPSSLVSSEVNMNSSLAPFIIIYDTSGQVVAGSGYLNGSVPIVPFGVLERTTATHENWVKWQPANGVRDAVVTTAADHYYVLSGRSLREVESRETKLLELSALGWLLSLVVLIVTWLFMRPYKHSQQHHGSVAHN